MKRHWRIHRQLLPYPDGQRRWDPASQRLLEWTDAGETRLVSADTSLLEMTADLTEEVEHAHRRVGAGVNAATSPATDQ